MGGRGGGFPNRETLAKRGRVKGSPKATFCLELKTHRVERDGKRFNAEKRKPAQTLPQRFLEGRSPRRGSAPSPVPQLRTRYHFFDPTPLFRVEKMNPHYTTLGTRHGS